MNLICKIKHSWVNVSSMQMMYGTKLWYRCRRCNMTKDKYTIGRSPMVPFFKQQGQRHVETPYFAPNTVGRS